MPKSAITFASLTLLGLLWLNVGAYFDGLAFYQSWFYPIVLLPIIMLSALACIGATIITLISVFRKKVSFSKFLLIAGLVCLIPTIPYLPLPGFTDGLQVAIDKKLDREKLITLAKEAKAITGVDDGAESRFMLYSLTSLDAESAEKFGKIKRAYPEAFEMSRLPARIDVTDDKVVVFYGSALTKHYGYAIVDDDQCPFERLSGAQCQRVSPNIWVYMDIY